MTLREDPRVRSKDGPLGINPTHFVLLQIPSSKIRLRTPIEKDYLKGSYFSKDQEADLYPIDNKKIQKLSDFDKNLDSSIKLPQNNFKLPLMTLYLHLNLV